MTDTPDTRDPARREMGLVCEPLQLTTPEGQTVWLVEDDDWKRVEAVVQAVAAAGEWPSYRYLPINGSDGATYPLCQDCGWSNTQHADDCPGVRIANALAALTTGGDS